MRATEWVISVLLLPVVLAENLPDCQVLGTFRGDLQTQPKGCCIRKAGITICKEYDEKKTVSPPVIEAKGSQQCGSFQHMQIQPIFARLQLDQAKRFGLDYMEIVQEGDGQFVVQESCDLDWCEQNPYAGCKQVFTTESLWLRFPNGTHSEEEHHVNSVCSCNDDKKEKLAREAGMMMMMTTNSSTGSNATNPHNFTIMGLEEELDRRRNLAKSIASDRMDQQLQVKFTFLDCMGSRHGEHPRPCVFPFKYHGVVHVGCIRDDDVQYWCPTELDMYGNYQSKHWGYCSAACKLELRKCVTVDGPITNTYCHFPFTYRGMSYYDCTTIDDKRPWCATETDRHGYYLSGKWGYCSCTNETVNGGGGGGGGGGTTTTQLSNATTIAGSTTTTATITTATTTTATTTTALTTTITTTTTTTTTTRTEKVHIPLSLSQMPVVAGEAVYIPSLYDDPVLKIIEKNGQDTYRPGSNIQVVGR